MQIKPEEITKLIKKQIADFDTSAAQKDVGHVTAVGDGIATVFGLDNAMVGELVEFPNDVYGMVLNLEQGSVGVALMGESRVIREGDQVNSTGTVMSVPVGKDLLGRVVNPLGQPIDGKGPIKTLSLIHI